MGFKKGHLGYWKGKHRSEETKRKMSEANTGQVPWNKGKRGIYSLEYRNKLSEANRRRIITKKTRHKLSEIRKRYWQDPTYACAVIVGCHTKPNRAERKLDTILQELLPGEFALNVHAEIMTLGYRIPDFVNVNGKKQLIELYGDHWHDPKQFPERQSPQERIDYFKQFGDWDTLIVWEHELKDEVKLKQKLQAFATGN